MSVVVTQMFDVASNKQQTNGFPSFPVFPPSAVPIGALLSAINGQPLTSAINGQVLTTAKVF